jgi:glucokinase
VQLERGDQLALVADIGGTNARFALAPLGGALELQDARTFKTADHPSMEAAAATFLRDLGVRVDRGVLAVAGAASGRRVSFTNCPWVIDLDSAPKTLGLSALHLVNDFAANARAACELGPDDVEMIGPALCNWGAAGTSTVVGPGTGLGMGSFHRGRRDIAILQGEGGHVGFAPGSPLEQQVLTALARRFGRVSWERLLCGPGLVNLHAALAEAEGRPDERLTAEQITSSADPAAQRTVALFCELLGAYAGDTVLMLGAWNGVYLTGGVLDSMRGPLRAGGFRRRFEDKGRFRPHLEATPSMVVDRPNLGLLGAAAFARDEAGL